MLSASSTMPTRKRSLVNEGEGEGGSGGSPKKNRTSKEAKPLDPKKFGGKTEEEVCQMLLPDHMASGLDIIFVSQATLNICSLYDIASIRRWVSIQVCIQPTWDTITAMPIITSVS